jgi:hypothetical protein
MHIVHQSAQFLLASFPFPLLAAPPAPKLLAAPHIDGLLPARVQQPAIKIKIEVVFAPRTYEEMVAAIEARHGPIQTIEEADAELEEMIMQMRAERAARRAQQGKGQDRLS